jgi:glycosyltransferase involved in cell wall biosynthesis
LISGLIATGKYSFRVFGGAIRHENYNTVVVNPDFIIKPTDGFGNKEMLRHALVTEKPDAILLFTDPRFFIWVWEMEDEIHQVCPIAYNHLWDNAPWPEFNRVLYESTDLINCINYPTYEMVHQRFPEKTNYIPHAVPTEIFHPIPVEEAAAAKVNLLGRERADHFIGLWIGRNARRKMASDIIVSWSMFINELQKKHGHRNATLLMHTDPLDQEGPNLHHVIRTFGVEDRVVFSRDRAEFQQMKVLHGVSDFSVNRSCAEGFGLPILEALQCGKPVIALKTGGLTRQVENHRNGFQHGIALEPEVKSLVGNQMVPYIYEDHISHETVAKAFMDMYEMGPEKRKELGEAAREHALNDYHINDMIENWDKSLSWLFENWKPSGHSLITI